MLIINRVYEVFVIDTLTTTSSLEIKKIRVFGAEKRRKTLAGHELGNNLFKKGFVGDILSGQDNVLMKDI